MMPHARMGFEGLLGWTLFFAFCQSVSLAQYPKEITNSIGMEFVLIPKGTFMMGSPEEEDDRQENEGLHEVTITKDFYLAKVELTCWQYNRILSKEFVKTEDALPATDIDEEQARDLCKLLQAFPEERAERRIYRLPTEAEWEYACRAGSTTAYSFDDEKEFLGDYGWFKSNSSGEIQPVGRKKPNAWGLYDMHGNVWERCSDYYGDYLRDRATDPRGPRKGTFSVIRGGGFDSEPQFCRNAYRGYVPESHRWLYGLRLVMLPPKPTKEKKTDDVR